MEPLGLNVDIRHIKCVRGMEHLDPFALVVNDCVALVASGRTLGQGLQRDTHVPELLG